MHCCLFCSKFKWKVAKHLVGKHGDEVEVKEILKLPLSSLEKRNGLNALVKKGDFQRNITALKQNPDASLLVIRESKGNDTDLVPCPHCQGFVSARKLHKHVITCTQKDISMQRPLLSSRAVLATEVSDGKFEDVNRCIISRMAKKDLAFLVIRNDPTLLLYASTQMQMKEKDRYKDIKYNLRLLGNLIISYRSVSGDKSASAKDLVLASNYENVLQAAKKLHGYRGPRDIEKPDPFRKTGFALSNLALIVRTTALKEDNLFLLNSIRSFLELYDEDWVRYSNNALSVLEEKKGNAPEQLPNEHDMRLLRSFCLQEIKKILESDDDDISVMKYKLLLKVTLCRLICFNARRGTEVSKLKFRHWNGVEDDRWKRKYDINNIDDIVEKKLAERLKLCYVEGKNKTKGKNSKQLVPILFTDETVDAIRFLIKRRALAGAADGNEYISCSNETYLIGWDVLHALTKMIDGLIDGKLLRPTRMRKLYSTMCQVLDMNDAEFTWLTNHFGHSKGTHQTWYRREDSTIELTKVAKVLTAIDEGKSIKNKKIDKVLSGEEEVIQPVPQDFTVTRNDSINKNKRKCEEAKENVPIKKRQKKWVPWTDAETKAVRHVFRAHFLQKKTPLQYDILLAMKNYPVLKDRSWSNIKDKFRSLCKKKV